MTWPAITVFATVGLALIALARKGDAAFVLIMVAGVLFCVLMHVLVER